MRHTQAEGRVEQAGADASFSLKFQWKLVFVHTTLIYLFLWLLGKLFQMTVTAVMSLYDEFADKNMWMLL